MYKSLLLRSFFAALWLSIVVAACSYSEKITDGKTAHQRRQYAVAIPMLEKEYAKAKETRDKAERAYMLAESYQRTNQYQKAAEWYNKADDHRYGKDEALQTARMYQQLEQYDDAVKAFQSAGRNAGDVNFYREQINASKNAKIWLKTIDSNEYSIQSLPINTAFNDFSAGLYGQDSVLFASDRKESAGKEQYKWTGKQFFDFYTFPSALLKEKTAAATSVQRAALTFNKEFHQATPCFNKDFTEIYFTECGSKSKDGIDYCKIMRSELKNGAWSEPKEQKLGEPQCNYLHPHLVETENGGKILYFASNTKSGYGGYDLYSAIWVEAEQKWSNARSLGNSINTKGNDVFPFMQADTLYFASDGHPTMGGLDIYRVERNPSTQRWTNLTNLKAPINSGGDDFGFMLLPNVADFRRDANDTLLFQVGMLTSNRISTGSISKKPTNLNQLEPKGGDDLYKFERRAIIPPPAADTPQVDTPVVVIAKAKIRLDGLVKAKVFKIAGNPNSGVVGVEPLQGASVQISSEDTAYTIGVEADGDFHLELRPNTTYTFRASKESYFNNSSVVSTINIGWDESKGDTTLTTEIVLEQIFTGQEIVLENIYYDYNDDKIRADAQPTLNELTELLKRNPQISIQLASHTDCRGADKYNEALSQRRAESAVRYLQEKGIAPERLRAKGFGESKPSNTCKCSECSEAEHQANRRTTFMVLE
jgi:peptidoglycan-associated lipoprotein